MPKIETAVEHSLGADEARRRLESLLDSIRADYGDMVTDLMGDWVDDRLKVSFLAYGFKISSDVVVAGDSVAVLGEIPWAAMPFKGKIQQTIVGKLEEVLA